MTESVEFLSKVRNILLAEPLTYDGRKALRRINMEMSEDDFYEEKVYVEPFSELDKKFDDSEIDEPNVSYREEVNLNLQKNKKATFENNLHNLTDALFVVKGVAGSGKTTYLHKIKRENQNDIDFHIWNFEEVIPSFDFMNEYFDIDEKYSDNVYKFMSILVREVSRILGRLGREEAEHKKHLRRITKNYYDYFMVSEERVKNSKLFTSNMDIEKQKKLFDVLCMYVDDIIDYSSMAKSLKSTFMSVLDNNKISSTDKLSFIAGFIIRLYFCLSKITNKKQIFVVDNIEVFIRHQEEDPVQVCELESILYGCNQAAKSIRAYLMPIQDAADYETFYGFLIMTRDTTASTELSNLIHYDDYKNENEMNISTWYCMEDIYASKINYYLNHGGELDENCYATAYKNILEDHSIYSWGMYGIVSKMFKHSHRRSVECVTDALAAIPKSEIVYLNEKWKQSNHFEKGHLKTMCRKYVLRILLDHVQKTDYFDKLLIKNAPFESGSRVIENYIGKSCSMSKESYSSSFARKISTVLHRYQLNYGTEKYMSLQKLVQVIAEKPYFTGNVPVENFKDIAKILFLMNETRNSFTNWTSLVCIKFSNQVTYNEDTLCKKIQYQWERYVNNEIELNDASEYGVKVTEAGSFFARFVADFEYFACRFLTNEPPLFSLKNIKSINDENNQRSFRAVEIIKIVRDKAFRCVEDIIEKDYDFFRSNTGSNMKDNFSIMHSEERNWLYKDSINDKEHVHPYRILRLHIGYISHYITFVEYILEKSQFELETDKELIIDLLKAELDEYRKKLEEIKVNHPYYFA